MPELPEVETVKRILQTQIIQKEIVGVDVFYPNILKNMNKLMFIQALKAQKIIDVKRRGKFLIFILSDGILVSHLRMEGKYYIKNSDLPVTKHEHIVFHLSDGVDLRYDDVRKFGTMHLFLGKSLIDVEQELPLRQLGVEPLTDAYDSKYLFQFTKKTNRAIKTVLLDQTIVSGIGNIYVNELCFLAKVHPATPANSLSKDKIQLLVEATKEVLKKAISLGGTSIHSFKSALEVSGRFQNELRVHLQKTCPICNDKIEKVYVGQRGTYYCPSCQKVH